jgi:pimeloyl-ACP methyl ester carboxylesterase
MSLTGLGDRVHLARPEIDLETHITDVVNAILANDLDEVILAGHSYAGIVITGVADRVPERLSQLVYVDSAPLASGMAMLDLFPPEAQAGLQQTVDEFGDGWLLPFPGFAALADGASIAGISEEQKLLVEAHAEPQPWRTYTQPLTLSGRGDASAAQPYQQVIIACDDMRSMVAAGVPEIMPYTNPPWRYIELETGHWPMFSAPDALAEVLGA